ncbi:hypothetical protein [Rathayibacter sp. AY1E8]|uniref:hypothetical protein n=1 Tax=Rathayibacter sp. AY1E8 TaxID=2080555 RepID=UPI0011B04462|nr:hypothetical protein [Rathayibacter sp. AY1E8]
MEGPLALTYVGTAAESASIVVRGYFDVEMFTPRWFLDRKLIGQAEYDNQSIEVFGPEIRGFILDWLSFSVEAETMQFQTANPEEFFRLRDAAMGTLRLLEDVEVSAVGLNHEHHLYVSSEEDLHAVGYTLVPKKPWSNLVPDSKMLSLIIRGTPVEGYSGYNQVKVEPSNLFGDAIYVSNNEHFSLRGDEAIDVMDNDPYASPTSEKRLLAIRILGDEWTDSLQRVEDRAIGVCNLSREVEL